MFSSKLKPNSSDFVLLAISGKWLAF